MNRRPMNIVSVSSRPTSEGCGYSARVDIGAYDTCPRGYVYCYASADKGLASGNYEAHDPSAPFLGYSTGTGTEWIRELESVKKTKMVYSEKMFG